MARTRRLLPLLLIIAGIGSSMGLNSVSQPVSRNVVPYAVAKKEKNMMTKHSLYVCKRSIGGTLVDLPIFLDN